MADYQQILAALDSEMDVFNNANLLTYSYNGTPIYNNDPMDIAWENVRYVEQVGRPYQEIFLMPAAPHQVGGSSGVSLESGIYQVNVYFPRDEGAGGALARCQQLRTYFQRGRNIALGGTKVCVERVPAISVAPRITADWYMRTVSIPYFTYS